MKIVLTLLAIGLLCYLGYIYKYKLALDDQYDDFYKNEYLNKQFRGTLKEIYNRGTYKKVITIKTSYDEFSYGQICTTEDFNNFIAVGDSVYKDSLSDKVYFKKANGQLKTYKLNFCD